MAISGQYQKLISICRIVYQKEFTSSREKHRKIKKMMNTSFTNDVVCTDNNDIKVTCGTQNVELSIFLCPIYFAGYNESLVALNRQFSDPKCQGTVEASVSPPVLTFTFPISDVNSTFCGNKLVITNAPGTGAFKEFSNIQFANISGLIETNDPVANVITYNQELVYLYSCSYPLEYIINDTRVDVAGVSIAINDRNGTFRSTLTLQLYSDAEYTNSLIIPESGLTLKTKIYAEVRATKLTDKFNVLLDHCYTSTSRFHLNSSLTYDLFIGCNKEQQTNIVSNGEDQFARFYFEAFRFTEHQKLPVSTFYLHCATRLCAKAACSDFYQCKRRKREVPLIVTTPLPDEVSDPSVISSDEIRTRNDNVVNTNDNSGTSGMAIDSMEKQTALAESIFLASEEESSNYSMETLTRLPSAQPTNSDIDTSMATSDVEYLRS
ncbi:zona pellucida-like domain-containing protein 1 [Hemiscyllium ocellatum]|uniref:zona pellucida-like domain-containing protein 1 n=1 Tax=Hemiscyllium ocellatum TaxID=170820 RepID=UPI002965F841|nr:zona pellucida-like domain-containing protein 1 [Hemiscyllium ocellatum]